MDQINAGHGSIKLPNGMGQGIHQDTASALSSAVADHIDGLLTRLASKDVHVVSSASRVTSDDYARCTIGTGGRDLASAIRHINNAVFSLSMHVPSDAKTAMNTGSLELNKIMANTNEAFRSSAKIRISANTSIKGVNPISDIHDAYERGVEVLRQGGSVSGAQIVLANAARDALEAWGLFGKPIREGLVELAGLPRMSILVSACHGRTAAMITSADPDGSKGYVDKLSNLLEI